MVAPLTIGKLKLATNLLLAPIAGYCDLGFRLVARSCGGVGMASTDLLCPEGVLRENYKSMVLAATNEHDSPICMQLYGSSADRLCDAARWAEDRGAHVIDINMGCPVDKITKRDGGSKLLCDVDNTLCMVEKIVAVLRHTPLTAKLRLGWDDTCIVAPKLAAKLEEAGIALVTIHGRTTEMRFGGQCRLDGIAAVVAAVKKIPVVGNGDVTSPQVAKHMMDYTGCAGVMIGRAALSQPWIFRDTWSYLTTGVIPEPLTIQHKAQLMRDHFRVYMDHRSERAAVVEFRKRVSWYAKQMHPCWPLKDEMRTIDSASDFERVISRFLEWREMYDRETEAERIHRRAYERQACT
ncbi:MAG TPA: tRNA dihydrouridine synthase DusB [Tepidisphaeraceae bacterium]|jgi:nifR3 family TIM-barrel protein|nr:tRNA dihydrouridine synthase DusB [Tepidisphaeraceae bacterium]